MSILVCCFSPLSAQSLQVTDDLGQKITITKPADKIVALSPHLAELVFDAGAGKHLLATVEHADFPRAAKLIPRLGSYNALDFEKLFALQPDIVLVWLSGNGDATVEKLRRLGFNVYVSEPRKLSDISKTIRNIGKLSGTLDIAEHRASKFDADLKVLQQRHQQSSTISIFYQLWDKPLITINEEQLIDEVIQLCGGLNIFAGLPILAPTVSTEELILKNPQVIIGGAKPQERKKWMQHWQQWSMIRAVQNNHHYFINPDLMSRQTTRMLDGAAELCSILDKVRNTDYD
ncbi:MAG: cobalamin-binding protein [Gammaproteobacteria bacterium]|nr:cobalamin-binding protein [Gammaproteobacteria bacterium]